MFERMAEKALLGTSPVFLGLPIWFTSEPERAGLAWLEPVYFHGDSRRQKERVGKKKRFNVADTLLLGLLPSTLLGCVPGPPGLSFWKDWGTDKLCFPVTVGCLGMGCAFCSFPLEAL